MFGFLIDCFFIVLNKYKSFIKTPSIKYTNVSGEFLSLSIEMWQNSFLKKKGMIKHYYNIDRDL